MKLRKAHLKDKIKTKKVKKKKTRWRKLSKIEAVIRGMEISLMGVNPYFIKEKNGDLYIKEEV